MLDDLYHLRERARAALARGDLDDAANSLVSAASQTHVAEHDYLSVLRPLAEVLARRSDGRSALTVVWYMAFSENDGWKRATAMLPGVPSVDRARTLAATGDMAGAAREMENAGLVAAAAIYREKADDWRGARALWSRLAQVVGGGADAYNGALVQFNLARCAKKCGDARQAREANVSAVRLLEEAADYFESVGQRERAFDCFQVLLAIGRETKTFEHVLEGYVNVLRILSEDHLRFYALQTYGEAIAAARAEGELLAAATLAREMGAYARKEGELAAAVRAGLTEAELWRAAATSTLEQRGSPARAEHALLAAVLALGENGQFHAIGEVYAELARVSPDEKRRAHYARSIGRYAGARDERLDAATPPVPKGDISFPDVWHVDLVEWEERGSAAEACADVLLDPTAYADVTRRRAMLARLVALAAEDPEDGSPESLILVAHSLTTLELYAALAPLERLARHADAGVREAAVRALSHFLYKRTFVTIRDRLADPVPAVARAAADTLERLVFAQAIDPLTRIYREAPSPEARHAALRALAKIERPEAAELLLSVIAYGARDDREAAVSALKASRGTAFVSAARAAMPGLDAHAREAVRLALESRQLA